MQDPHDFHKQDAGKVPVIPMVSMPSWDADHPAVDIDSHEVHESTPVKGRGSSFGGMCLPLGLSPIQSRSVDEDLSLELQLSTSTITLPIISGGDIRDVTGGSIISARYGSI